MSSALGNKQTSELESGPAHVERGVQLCRRLRQAMHFDSHVRAHRDGVDFVLVLLIERQNIARGNTTVYDRNQHELGSFTLTDPFDAALVDDTRVYHGVTPVIPLDPKQPAYRDVLVVTCKRDEVH